MEKISNIFYNMFVRGSPIFVDIKIQLFNKTSKNRLLGERKS